MPFMLLPCFYLITGLAKGQKLNEITEQMKSEWVVASTGTNFSFFFTYFWIENLILLKDVFKNKRNLL